MKNRSRAGNKFQDWIEAWILKNHPGSVVHNQKAVSKIIKIRDKKTGQLVDRWVSQRNDIFGCIDLVWITAQGTICFIQATEDRGIGRKLAELNKVPWCLSNCLVQLWLKREPGRVDVYNLNRLKELDKICTIIRGKASFEF